MGNHLAPNGTFQSNYQIVCPNFSMQYFDHCFLEHHRPFQSPEHNNLKNSLYKAQLSCRRIDGTHRSNALTVLYDRIPMKNVKIPRFDTEGNEEYVDMEDLVMQNFENCVVVSKNFFHSTDHALKTFFCQAQLTCGPTRTIFGTLPKKDLTVLYRGRKQLSINT